MAGPAWVDGWVNDFALSEWVVVVGGAREDVDGGQSSELVGGVGDALAEMGSGIEALWSGWRAVG